MKPLEGMRVVNLAVNLPGPAAAKRLEQLGARVCKVEPPTGDPLAQYCPRWYEELNAGQQIQVLDLKSEEGRSRLDAMLREADLLVTASRPAALARLGLGWQELHRRFPRLCQVAIVGYPPPREDEPGHDLTYQARMGLLSPPRMPRTLLADMAGAERAVSAALALLLARERGVEAGYARVALAEAAAAMAEPLRHGVTAPGALLGGGLPGYNIYRAGDGWVAVAALEPHFKRRLDCELGCEESSIEELRRIFPTRTAAEWQQWGRQRDLPIVEVCRGGATDP